MGSWSGHGVEIAAASEPTALPTGKDGMGHHHKPFEAKAAKLLKPLEGAAVEISSSCVLPLGEEAFSIRAERENGGRMFIEASVGDRLGGVFAKKKIHSLSGHGFLAEASALFLNARLDEGDPRIDVVRAVAEGGLGSVAAMLDAEGLRFNGGWSKGPDCTAWVQAFHPDSPVDVQPPENGRPVMILAARTTLEPPVEIWMTETGMAVLRRGGKDLGPGVVAIGGAAPRPRKGKRKGTGSGAAS